MCIFGFWEENEKWINFKNKTENLKSLSKYKTEKTEHSVLTDEICLSERKRCYPVSANHDGTGEIIGAFCIEMDMQSAYGMVEETNHISIICGLVAGAVLLLICLYTYYVYQKSKNKNNY